MVVFSFHIFDRHTECIYSKRWNAVPAPTARPQSGSSVTSNGVPPPAPRRRNDADDAKLIFGTVFSLRNMTTRLGGENDVFLSYRTNTYKLHYFETPTRMKFVMITDTKASNMRIVLHQIWANLYVEYVVKNPLAPVEHKGGKGVANDAFEMGLDAFIGGLQ